MANAQVILKEKIEGLGAEADVVKVRAGYARNFLIPQGKAYEATKSNLRHVEALKAGRAAREAEELLAFQEIATKISKLKPKFTLSTGQGGKAFGSVTSIDIHKELEAAGIVFIGPNAGAIAATRSNSTSPSRSPARPTSRSAFTRRSPPRSPSRLTRVTPRKKPKADPSGNISFSCKTPVRKNRGFFLRSRNTPVLPA